MVSMFKLWNQFLTSTSPLQHVFTTISYLLFMQLSNFEILGRTPTQTIQLLVHFSAMHLFENRGVFSRRQDSAHHNDSVFSLSETHLVIL